MKNLLLIALLALTGCSTTNISEMVKALGQDTNTVSIDVSTPWGTVHATRNIPYRVQVP